MSAYLLARQQRRNLVEDVVYTSAAIAIEMSMCVDVSIVAHPMVVYGNHLCRIVLGKHAQRIVYRSSTERGYLGAKSAINIIHRWMGEVCEQVVHYSYALYRWLYAMLSKSCYCFFVVHFLFIFITFTCFSYSQCKDTKDIYMSKTNL